MKAATLLISIILLLSALGLAQPVAPRLNFAQVLTGLDGKPIMDGAGSSAKPLTLSTVAVYALEATLEEDRQSSGEQKFQLDQLARKVYDNRDAVLTVDETALLKKRIGEAYGPLVVGAAWRLLDPAVSSPPH